MATKKCNKFLSIPLSVNDAHSNILLLFQFQSPCYQRDPSITLQMIQTSPLYLCTYSAALSSDLSLSPLSILPLPSLYLLVVRRSTLCVEFMHLLFSALLYQCIVLLVDNKNEYVSCNTPGNLCIVITAKCLNTLFSFSTLRWRLVSFIALSPPFPL